MDRIKWDLSNNGWKVGLGVDITKHLVEGLPMFVTELVQSAPSSDVASVLAIEDAEQRRRKVFEVARSLHWAIHPGGRAIVDAIEKCFELKGDQLASTRDVMSKLGNMSSPTVLFVLNNLRNRRCEAMSKSAEATENSSHHHSNNRTKNKSSLSHSVLDSLLKEFCCLYFFDFIVNTYQSSYGRHGVCLTSIVLSTYQSLRNC